MSKPNTTLTAPAPTFDELLADARGSVAKLNKATRALAAQHIRDHGEHAWHERISMAAVEFINATKG
jgi:hypothetical protein